MVRSPHPNRVGKTLTLLLSLSEHLRKGIPSPPEIMNEEASDTEQNRAFHLFTL